MMSEIDSQQLRSEVVESLRQHGDRSAMLGSLSMAGQIYQAIHTLHLTRNQLPQDEHRENKTMFLNGSIKILEKELERNLLCAQTYYQAQKK